MINEERGKRAEGLRRPYAGDAERLTSRSLRRIGEDVLDHPLQDGQIVFHFRTGRSFSTTGQTRSISIPK
jgi:hypothetical protein